jgi:hypothetical protein
MLLPYLNSAWSEGTDRRVDGVPLICDPIKTSFELQRLTQYVQENRKKRKEKLQGMKPTCNLENLVFLKPQPFLTRTP